jgi:hypothetical protein
MKNFIFEILKSNRNKITNKINYILSDIYLVRSNSKEESKSLVIERNLLVELTGKSSHFLDDGGIEIYSDEKENISSTLEYVSNGIEVDIEEKIQKISTYLVTSKRYHVKGKRNFCRMLSGKSFRAKYEIKP